MALGATVVDVGTESATVAVAPEEARGVAFALANGVVTMPVTPGPGPRLGAGPGPAVAEHQHAHATR